MWLRFKTFYCTFKKMPSLFACADCSWALKALIIPLHGDH
jgi:hypothetical protein